MRAADDFDAIGRRLAALRFAAEYARLRRQGGSADELAGLLARHFPGLWLDQIEPWIRDLVPLGCGADAEGPR